MINVCENGGVFGVFFVNSQFIELLLVILYKKINGEFDMEKIKVKIVNSSGNALPAYGTPLSAGMDLRAWLNAPVTLQPLERRLIPTGVKIALPEGYECQLRPRSGLALKRGLTLLNTPGTIDADYRGEIGVIVVNLSNEPQTIENGERICQMVVARHETVEWEAVTDLDETERGAGGFGHTGTK